MATYSELAVIAQDAGFGEFVQKVRVAVVVKAVAFLGAATPTPAEIEWSVAALDEPGRAAHSVTWYVIAANSGAAVAQILGATDTAIQSNVNAAIDKIVLG